MRGVDVCGDRARGAMSGRGARALCARGGARKGGARGFAYEWLLWGCGGLGVCRTAAGRPRKRLQAIETMASSRIVIPIFSRFPKCVEREERMTIEGDQFAAIAWITASERSDLRASYSPANTQILLRSASGRT
jgi:hypothetical protein